MQTLNTDQNGKSSRSIKGWNVFKFFNKKLPPSERYNGAEEGLQLDIKALYNH